MILTYSFDIQYNNKLNELFLNSKNLYNQALYEIKQSLKNDKFLFYNDLNKLMMNKINLDGNINYKLLKAQVSQQILMNLDKNVKSYFKSIKDWSKNKSKYKSMPKLPNYKKDKNLLIYTNQCSSIKNNIINLSKDIKIKLPLNKSIKYDFNNYKQIRLIPNNKYITIEIIYDKQIIKNNNLDENRYLSIDLGINNLMSCITDNEQPFIINGKQIKSINQFYNKQKQKLTSIKDKQKIKGYTKKLYELEHKRSKRIKDILHKISKYIIDYCIKKGIKNIVVGYNKQWKQSINLGNKTNQTFVSIPFQKLINNLLYKSELNDMNMIMNEESYTSKCDSLALESVSKQTEYKGKRIKRGLFLSSIGKIINADINGSLNILRKYLIKTNVVNKFSYIKKIIDSGLLFNQIKLNNIYNLKLNNI